MNRYSDLSENAHDILREISNIGTGNAVTSLASMIGRQIDIELPEIQIMGYNDVPGLLGDIETVQVGILLDVSGDLKGMFMFLLDESFTKEMIKLLLGKELYKLAELDELDRSAICEIGNIMCCSYMNAISMMTGMTMNVSVPDMCCDMVGAILSVPMIHFANLSDEILFIENQYGLGNMSLVSHILFLPEIESLKKIFDAFGEPYEN
ncbi:chemotaxis protein CheC [Clostridium sp. AM58-1XD]|uniref:chemotaxis protein CheC n=1 Tax=Clostridium sp. AM58-1XD TaxID=2292307 RepID=UPI0015F4BAB3|nr:chemotaxis protein CheC [Clostridium sp. AM58-1XD]